MEIDPITGILEEDAEDEAPMGSISKGFLASIARIDDAPPPAEHLELIGKRLGRFRVAEFLDKGGMGVVYRAVDESLRRDVTLKVLPSRLAGEDERRRRLMHEARSAAAVNHPCVACAVLEGLSAVHAAGLIHRNFKPSNVAITDDGAVKVLGLGVREPPEEGMIRGTPTYMSPEQARGEPLDHRSDMFAFGVVLYEMLTGRRPFEESTSVDVLVRILSLTPAPVSEVNPEVSAELSRVVERCLAKDAASRYDDCRTVARALEHAMGTAR